MRSGGSAVSEREPIRQRVIVFIAGGMTYSEMRTAYQAGAKLQRDVYIGTFLCFFPFLCCLCVGHALFLLVDLILGRVRAHVSRKKR